jgi:uncharacterized protein YqeY
MSIQLDIKEKIKDAMRAKDTLMLTTLRGMSAAFTNELVAQKKTPQEELDDASALNVIKRLSKQRKDSIEQFTKGGREDLAETEKAELAIIEKFLPQMMSREEIKAVAIPMLCELGVTDKSGIGKATGMVMKKLGSNADGSDVKAVLEELLG